MLLIICIIFLILILVLALIYIYISRKTKFDKIYYINLDRRQDRKKHVEKQIKPNFNKYIRFSAIDGKNININNIATKIISIKGKKDIESNNKIFGITLTKGAIGCALSHMKIWEEISKKDYNQVLILEDDIEIKNNIKNYHKIFKQIPNNWDIIYLGSGQYKKTKKINKNVFKLDHAFQTIGYVINSKSAQKLLKHVFPLDQQIDSSIFKNFKNINAYIIEPNMIIPRRDLISDIQIK